MLLYIALDFVLKYIPFKASSRCNIQIQNKCFIFSWVLWQYHYVFIIFSNLFKFLAIGCDCCYMHLLNNYYTVDDSINFLN